MYEVNRINSSVLFRNIHIHPHMIKAYERLTSSELSSVLVYELPYTDCLLIPNKYKLYFNIINVRQYFLVERRYRAFCEKVGIFLRRWPTSHAFYYILPRGY